MAKVLLFVLAAIIALAGFGVHRALQPPPLPQLEETWWGPGKPGAAAVKKGPRKFTINIDDESIKDLKYRLEHHRPFVPPLEGVAQDYGMNTNLLKDVVEFWKTKYDWKEREKVFNQFPQYKINVQGLDIHYLHVKPQRAEGLKVVPLLLIHGWPGSVREFFSILPLLTTPQKGSKFVFEVIAPSIPGYGFSQTAARRGLGVAEMALLFKNMMTELGFKKFYAQGGDFGAIILQHLSIMYPENVLGFHSNMCTTYTPLAYIKHILSSLWPSFSPWYVRPDHYERVFPVKEKFFRRVLETGYLHLQASKPDTLGVGLGDSPVGLAAYILEKFTTGTNLTFQKRVDGGLKEFFTYTDLLDNVMVYWWTNTATTSFRLYAESFSRASLGRGINRHPVQVPSACARFSYDFYTSDGLLKDAFPNLLHLSDYDAGHFAAFQVPEVLAKDIFIAVEKFEDFNRKV